MEIYINWLEIAVLGPMIAMSVWVYIWQSRRRVKMLRDDIKRLKISLEKSQDFAEKLAAQRNAVNSEFDQFKGQTYLVYTSDGEIIIHEDSYKALEDKLSVLETQLAQYRKIRSANAMAIQGLTGQFGSQIGLGLLGRNI